MPSLTVTGSPTYNGDGSCTINATGPDILYAPASALDETQGWVAVRVKATWSSPPVSFPALFFWGDSTSVRVYGIYNSGSWTCGRNSGTENDAVSPAAPSTWTLIFSWTATLLKVSNNGGAFTTTANATIPTIASATWAIGSGEPVYNDRNGNLDFYWVAAGLGAPSDANAATIHAFGNTDPAWSSFPVTPTFLWYATSATYYDSDPGPLGSTFVPRVIAAY